MKFKNLVLFIGCLMGITSCEDNIKEVPLSFLEESNSFQSASDATSAINAVYDRLKEQYGMNMINLADLNSDQEEVREDNAYGSEIHKNLFNSGSSLFDNFYSAAYITIDRANRVIQNVPTITMDEKLKSQIIGEAKFIRALSYFNLVRAFGDVPLVTLISNDVVNVNIARAPSEEVYTQIIRDLQDAEALLPPKYTAAGEIGRATIGAAKSILSKVYLTRKEWKKAADKANEVIGSGVYSLVNDYRAVFDPDKENGAEHIFSIQYSCILPQYGSSMAVSFAIYFSYPINLVGGTYQATPQFVDSYSTGDYRKEVTIIYSKTIANGSVVDSRTGPHIDKYWDPKACGSSSARNNFLVIRYADVLLMYAEAMNELSGPSLEAFQAINKVRARARNGNNEVLPDLANLSQETFRKAIQDERRWELAFEGHGRWDLLRTDTYIEKMKNIGVRADQKHLLYPIPINEMDVNTALTQNSGY